jgi:hypothetical protein
MFNLSKKVPDCILVMSIMVGQRFCRSFLQFSSYLWAFAPASSLASTKIADDPSFFGMLTRDILERV